MEPSAIPSSLGTETNQVLLFTGVSGIGKSTRFPLTLSASGKVLVITPTKIGSQVLTEYVNSPLIDYQHMTVVYQHILNRTLSTDYKFIIIDDIQLGRLEQILILLLLQEDSRYELILTGLIIPVIIPKLLRKIPKHLTWPNNSHPVALRYLEADLLDDQQRATELRETLEIFTQQRRGHILIIAPNKHKAKFYADQLTDFVPVLVTEDTYHREIFQTLEPKIIISSPVLEVTITIPDLEIVIDTMEIDLPVSRSNGKVYHKLSWISRIQAEQRKGRAGRTRPGLCIRFCSEATFNKLPVQYPSEFEVLDLTTIQLQWILRGYSTLSWPDQMRADGWDELINLKLIQEIGSSVFIPDRFHAELVSKLPVTPWPGDLLARWLQAGGAVNNIAYFCAFIELVGPFLRPLDFESLRRPKWSGPSDFHTLVNILTVTPLPKEVDFERWSEVQQLARAIITTAEQLGFTATSTDIMTDFIRFQQLIRSHYQFLIYSWNDNLGKLISSDGRKLLPNDRYPNSSEETVLAVLAVDGNTAILTLGVSD